MVLKALFYLKIETCNACTRANPTADLFLFKTLKEEETRHVAINMRKKGNDLGKHSLLGKIEDLAASVLLKLFINGGSRCHTIDAP